MGEMKYSFQRYELKYLLREDQYREMMEGCSCRLEPDGFGNSTICNVYYDTSDHRLIRHSLEKPVYKEKLRLRSYGSTKREDQVFLELKKKYQGVVYKRRISLRASEAEGYFARGHSLPTTSQISREIDYVRRLYEPLLPAMYLSYDRAAFFSKEDQQLRLTFDRNIRFRETDLSLGIPPYGTALLEEGLLLLEVKTAGRLPLWLTGLLSELQLAPTSYSKYGAAYQRSCQEKELGGVSYAS